MKGAVCPRWRPGRRRMETGGGHTEVAVCAPPCREARSLEDMQVVVAGPWGRDPRAPE